MLTQDQIDAVGIRHGIHPRFRIEFLKLANKAEITNRQFGARLCTCENYQRAFHDVMALLKESK